MELKMGGKNLIKSNRKVILEGMRDGIPIGLGYLAVSFSLGIAAKTAGLNAFQSFLASLLLRFGLQKTIRYQQRL